MPLLHNKGNKKISLNVDKEGNVFTSLSMLDGTKFKVKLAGGGRHARQIKTIKECIMADKSCSMIGDSKIWIDNKNRAILGLACKIVPNKQKNRSGTLKVCTSRESFIIAVKEKDTRPFTINGDHVKRWILESKRKQERLRQDSKCGQSNVALKSIRQKISKKQNNRMDSFTHETSSYIVDFAKRRNVSKIEYDGTIKSYFGSNFPYFEFEQKLIYKCGLADIEFEKVTKDIIPATLDEPHVYIVAPINGNIIDNQVKIGMTTQKKGKRKKSLEGASGKKLLILCTIKLPKS